MNAPETSAYTGVPVLVTGGASFIGSHLCEWLVKAGARITVADDCSSGKIENLGVIQGDIVFKKGDLRDAAFTRDVVRGQAIVFHLAAAHGGRGYIETHPVECMNNLLLDHTVFAEAARAGARKIVHASSACVYPTHLQTEKDRLLLKDSDAGFDEPGRAFADGEYDWAKLMGEMQLRAFHKQHGLDGVACRIFTAYGERENESHAVIALIAKAIARMDPFPIWGNGKQTRNFTYVGDIVTGLGLAGATLSGFAPINVGSSTHNSVLELCEEIFSVLGWRPQHFDFQMDKPIGVGSRAADSTFCKRALGWAPGIPLGEGIRKTVTWYAEANRDVRPEDLERRLMERD